MLLAVLLSVMPLIVTCVLDVMVLEVVSSENLAVPVPLVVLTVSVTEVKLGEGFSVMSTAAVLFFPIPSRVPIVTRGATSQTAYGSAVT